MKYRNGNGFSLKTGCLVIVIIGVLLYSGLAIFQCVKQSATDPPDAKTAGYIVTTSSRMYLAQDGIIKNTSGATIRELKDIPASYTLNAGEVLVLKNWYDKNEEGKWKYHKGDSPPLLKDSYGEITVAKRIIKQETKKK